MILVQGLCRAILYNIFMRVELLLEDLTREITGSERIFIDLPNGSSYEDILYYFLKKYPILEGILINPDQRTLVNGNLLIADDEIIPPHELNTRRPSNGARIRFHAFIVGG